MFTEQIEDFIARQSPEAWGFALVLIGLAGAGAIYLDILGPAGQLLADGAQAAFGWVRFALPAAFIVCGASMIRDREDHLAGRLALWLLVVVVGAAGIVQLFNGPRQFDTNSFEVGGSGGWVGLGVGHGLQSIIGPWGAGLLLILVTLVGVLSCCGLTVGDALAYSRERLDLGRDALAERKLRKQGEVIDLRDQPDDEYEEYEDEEYEDGEYDEDYDEQVDGEFDEEDEEPEPSVPEPAVKVSVPKPDSVAPAHQLDMGLNSNANSNWKLPSVTLLKRAKSQSVDRRLLEAAGKTLERALEQHSVDAHLVGMTVGPSITQFQIELGPGVKVSKVVNLNKDIAYAMAAADVRILAPIPGKSAIGIEVPNQERALVALGDILTSEEAVKARHPLEVGVGRDINGRSVMENLATMPHILIAGATGAGKSSCINSLITSLLIRNTPDDVRLILIDPKRVELGQYNGVPHLLTQVVTDPKKAANALQWTVAEMDKRYQLLAQAGVRDIKGYNEAWDKGTLGETDDEGNSVYPRLANIVVVVDELNDLMMVAARDVEASITRIAQMARAVGIHLVLATQRPSVNVITGVIKANIPSRLAFAVSSLADSRVILDQAGAERLIGQGDMLLSKGGGTARRIQGAWVSEDEVRRVAEHWQKQAKANSGSGVEAETQTNDEITAGSSESSAGGGFGGGGDDDDDLFEQAMELVVRSKLGSTSMLQRKLRVGFARAGRLMDLLEQRGVVGPSEGSKARTVLMTVEELEARDSADSV